MVKVSRWRVRKVRAGDAARLQPFRWWETLSRSLFSIDVVLPDAPQTTYAVEVRQLGDHDDGVVRARLYRDGRCESVSTVPARFPVPGGRIEVAVGTYGMKRCHLVTTNGDERPLEPHASSLEGRRARLHHAHPVLSRAVGAVSALLVLAGVAVALPQLVESILQVPPIMEAIGRFELPYDVSFGVNAAAIVAAAAGSAERALRFRSSWLDDLAG